jgi:Uncharacterized protein conserved in bacteria (DUF2188)
MNKKSYHIIAQNSGWKVLKTGGTRASGRFSKQSDAVREARILLGKSGGEIIVHTRDGRVSRRDFLGNDPTSSNGAATRR